MRPIIRWVCERCGVELLLEEADYRERYAGQSLCLACRCSNGGRFREA